jgi:ABC-type branched-subunit amino acid transport system ATPase component
MTHAVLQTYGLTVGYGQASVIEKMDLVVNRGEVVVLLGRNGAGKTTTLLTLAGALPALGGRVLMQGMPPAKTLHARASGGMAFIPETRAVVRRLSVKDNLRLGGGSIDTALDFFPQLRPLTSRKAGLLSGGEQQMLVLARVLSTRPRLLLVDELSLGLAPMIVAKLLATLREAATSSDTGVLLVEQHLRSALSVADRGYVVSSGRIVLDGSTQSLSARLPEIENAYLSGPAVNSD